MTARPAGASGSDRDTRAVLRNVYACYFLSGALGLIYEILWLRKLLLIFGASVHAVSTVLTVFFGGLALGSWWFGRLIDRRGAAAGLRWYAGLEAGIGLCAFLTLPLFDQLRHIYIPLYRASGLSEGMLVGATFVCSALVLLVPTTLLGGTFPVLSRFLIRTSEERGPALARLYAVNTSGAVLGTLWVYFVGLPGLGLVTTLFCAGVLSLGLGVLCLAFDRHLESLGFGSRTRTDPAASGSAAHGGEAERALRRLTWAFGMSGFAAMIYEVAWTRALGLVLGSSTYAFCVMLATFLGGMALGSAAAGPALRRGLDSLAAFVRLEVLLAGCGLVSILLFHQLPDSFVTLWPLLGGSFEGLTLLQVALSALVMLVPTLALGYVFPVVSTAVTARLPQLGRRLGAIYAVNTCGGILGSFLAGFWLIPQIGLPWTIVTAAAMNAAAAGLVFGAPGTAGASRRLALSAAGIAGLLVLAARVVVPTWQRQAMAAGVYLSAAQYQGTSVARGMAGTKLVYYKDSLHTTVTVHQSGDTLFLKVGGKTDASTGLDMSTQALSAHIPMLLHPRPQRVLVIGLGSGVTLGHAGRYPVTTLDCAEIDPAVVEGARFFTAKNYGVHDDPRTRLFIVDGRNFLLAAEGTYDVLISEPSNPWMSGLAYLFTREFYDLAKARLAPDGVMCQWLQLYAMFPGDVKLILKTYHDAFPYVSVWSSVAGDLLLIGSQAPHAVPYEELARRMRAPAVAQGLREVKVDGPGLLLESFILDQAQIERMTVDLDALHEDNLPSLEFSAPRALYLARGTLELNTTGLSAFRQEPSVIAAGYPAQLRQTAEFQAGVAALFAYRLEHDQAREALERAVSLPGATARTRRALGEAYGREGQWLRAAAVLREAVKDEPSPASWLALARALWRQGMREEARPLFERARAEAPEDGEIAEEAGNFFADLKLWELAAEAYAAAHAQGRATTVGFCWRYGEMLRQLGDWPALEARMREAVARFPDGAGLHRFLGLALLEQGRADEAEPALQRARALDPRQADVYVELGRAALAQGRADEALRHMRRALVYNPYHLEALDWLARLRRAAAAPAHG